MKTAVKTVKRLVQRDFCDLCEQLVRLLNVDDNILIDFTQSVGNRELRSSDVQSYAAAAREVGVCGESEVLQKTLNRMANLKSGLAPVLFIGAAGVGKLTFARLLHRVSTNGSSSLVVFDCRKYASSMEQFIPLEDIINSLESSHKPGIILLHPEALSGKWCKDLFAKFSNGQTCNVRFYITLDSRISNIFINLATAKLRSELRANSIFVPDLAARKDDIRQSILWLLSGLNKHHGLRKRIYPNALEQLAALTYNDNFRTLRKIVEFMYETQPSVLQYDEKITRKFLSEYKRCSSTADLGDGFNLKLFLNATRGKIISRALTISGNNQAKTANLLGITPQAVNKFLRKK